MSVARYYLGCPGWGMKTWVGRLFPKGTKQADFLKSYAAVFNTVEGNTTFYGLPSADNVLRWRDDTPEDFSFCFKFPKKVSHEKLLLDSSDIVDGFLKRVAPLGPKLGTLMLQLPPRFGAKQLERLASFLRGLPNEHRYAVELRHPTFFNGGVEEQEAASLFGELNVDTVIMDARGLHSTNDPELAEVRERKPNLPVVMRATGSFPVVRCVPHSDLAAAAAFYQPWVDQIARWIEAGKRPYFFMHAPDDTFAPEHAYRFHEALRRRLDVGELPPWNGPAAQPSLF